MIEEEARLEQLERNLDTLARRVAVLEGGLEPMAQPPGPPSWSPPAAGSPATWAERQNRPPIPPTPRPAPRRAPKARHAWRDANLEDLLGGRVLAWVGGAALVLGVAFLFAVAVSRGWIGEGARTLLAGAGSFALVLVGVWLHELKGRTDAALAAVGAGLSALFVTVTVAAQVYDLLPEPIALALALLVGATGTALAVRWESRVIAALGIVGSLLSPVLADAPLDGGTVALLFVAMSSAVAVLVWQRWDWLALVGFVVVTPQWVAWLFGSASLAGALAALLGFGALGVAAAVGHELRVAADRLPVSSSFMLVLNAMVVAAAGWLALDELGHQALAKGWLWALAAAHVAVGLTAARSSRVPRELAVLALALGVLLADVAFALVADGPVLTLGWALTGVGFAAVARRLPTSAPDLMLAQVGLGAHIALAVLQALVSDPSLEALVDGGRPSLAAAISLVAVAAGCFVSARLSETGRPTARIALDTLGLAAVAYLTAVSLDGAALVAVWAVESAGLAAIARRDRDEVAFWGSLAFLALAALHALVFEATPDSLVSGVDEPPAAALALGAVTAGFAWGGYWLPLSTERRRALFSAAAVSALYLASVLIVTPFQPGADSGAEFVDLEVRQQGQMLLSVFWALVGVAGLVAGLRRDLRALRLGCLGLLLLTVAKVFLFDLATLTSVYRVVSFIGLGLLLLGAAFVWQRLRPRGLPDLREAPRGIR